MLAAASNQPLECSSEDHMMSVVRPSITEHFEINTDTVIPDITPGGARVKVFYAGACYSNAQVINSGQHRPRVQGIMDTSLFPGFEVSGTVDAICPTVADSCALEVGDRVVVYIADEEEFTETGFAEFVLVDDISSLIKIPTCLPLDLAATLPSGALAAYAAVERVKPFIAHQLERSDSEIVNVLIVGAGGLGLWCLRVAEYYIGTNQPRVHLIVADNNVDKLVVAKEHGCYDVIHWCDSLHEEYIEMRTRNVCKGGVDAVIDFASSARSVGRSLKVLKEGGAIVVGGNSKCDVPFRLHTLASLNQTIFGVHRGSREQLIELVELVAYRKILPPVYSVFPVEEADTVFRRLSQSKIDGRAVLCVFSDVDSSNAGSCSSPCSPEPDDLMMTTTSTCPDATDRPVSKGFFLP